MELKLTTKNETIETSDKVFNIEGQEYRVLVLNSLDRSNVFGGGDDVSDKEWKGDDNE